MSQPVQICTFTLDDLLIGIEVQQIQEVIRFQPMTPVPLAPPVVAGLINLRGQIVTATDLRLQLGMPPTDLGDLPMNIIIRSEESTVSLLVDDFGDVIEVDPAEMEPPPDTLPEQLRRLLDSVYKLPDSLLLIVNTQELTCTGPAPAAAVA